MSGLTYVSPPELRTNICVGDVVEIADRNGNALGRQKIVRVRKRYVMTDCGRRWTTDFGWWISEWRGNIPVSWPFPSIRATCQRCDTFHDDEQQVQECKP